MSEGLKSFLGIIRKMRIEKGYTQAQLASKLDINTRTYQRMEVGEFPPKVDVLMRLTEVFGLDTLRVFADIFAKNCHYKLNIKESRSFDNYKETRSRHQDNALVLDDVEILGIKKFLGQSSDIQKIGYWEWGVDDHSFFWSDELYRFYSYEKRPGLTVSFDELITKLAPEDAVELGLALENLLKYSWPFKNVHRVSHEGQEKVICSTAKKVMRNDKCYIFGVAEDITHLS